MSISALTLGPVLRAHADTEPPGAGEPATVSSDPLPTVQIDGVVWTQLVVGTKVYVGGSFTTARPAGAAAGTQTVARSNFLVYDVETGALDSFAPAFNGQIRSIAVSPDKSTLYVGGQFTTVNGVNRYRIVAFDIASGNVKAGFAVTVNSTVFAIAATTSSVYLVGNFTVVNGANRVNAAAVDPTTGAVRDFSVTPTGGTVRSVIVSPDGAKVVLAGNFVTLNGSGNPGYGMAMVDGATGTLLPFAANSVLRNGNTNAAFTSLAATESGFYGTGFSYSRTQGNVEGAFRVDWNGNLVWVQDCHGDTYSLAVSGDAVYVAGHPHECSSVGAFPQTQPWTFHRALSFSSDVRGVSGQNPNNYSNFTGKPTPAQLNWYPDINAGTFTGQSQGPWSVAANDDYVLYGGEFTEVNGKAQQGLVRFAKKTLAPNNDGPRLGGSTAGVAVRSHGDRALRVSWPANYDRDNERLSYRLFRDDVLVFETAADSRFYSQPNLSYLDTRVEAGRNYTYKVKASDPLGNSAWSSSVTGSTGTGSALSAYQRAVLKDGPQSYWPLNETGGSAITDLAGTNPGTKGSQASVGVPGAVTNDSATAYRLSGASSASTMVDTVAKVAPDHFSTEAWFRSTSTKGGQIIGLDSASAGGSSVADRHIYLTNSGQVAMAVRPSGVVKSVTSAGTYRDGMWHHVVGTMGPAGMALYIDGVQVGINAEAKSGQLFGTKLGYWKMGGDTLSWAPNKPTSNFLAGDLDEIAVYPVPLTPAQVKAHYDIGISGVAPNVNPSAAFTVSATHLAVQVDGSASSDSDGTVSTYAWEYGDGGTGSGVTDSHVYASPGTYTVKVTVTDDRGGMDTTSREVIVERPPNQTPKAAFAVSSDGLAVSVDGSDASDSDGTIDEYAWDFGDGTTGDGKVDQHTYAAAGSYLIKLKVTDDRSGTATASKLVTVPAGNDPYAFDEFERTESSGLGNAVVGGAWTTQGAGGFSVGDGVGLLKLTTAGASRSAYLPGATSNSTDLRLTLSADKPATGGGIYTTVIGRRVSATEDYRLNLRMNNSGKVTVSLGALQGSTTATGLSSTVTVPGSYAEGSPVHVRLQISGSGATTVRAKVWLGSDVEPDTWLVSASDSYAGLQAPGSIGLIGYVSGSATNAPINLALHRILATP